MSEQENTDMLGFGPLEPLLADGTITEILVDGPDKIYVERHGKLQDAPGHFGEEEDLLRICYHIVTPLGLELNESNPIVDARTPDGSFVNIVIPPISLIGPVLTIRKISEVPLTLKDLLRFGCLNENMVAFLRACFLARLNILIAGGTGSGKTTLLNILAGMIPSDERVISIESKGELQLSKKLGHLIRLVARPPDKEGKGEITIRDLVINSLRMRPDRVIFGEVQGSEALDILQLMDIGRDGTLFTLHANSPHDALTRFETMALMDNFSLPLSTIRHELASAVDLIIYQERLGDGTRKILNVTEVVGMQSDAVVLQDIFQFRQTGTSEGKIVGYHTATGTIPRFLSRFRDTGIELPLTMFTPQSQQSIQVSGQQ